VSGYLWNQGSRNEVATQDDIRRIISGAGRGWSDDYMPFDLPDEWRTPVRHDPSLSECEWPGCSWRTSGRYCSKHPPPPKVIQRPSQKRQAALAAEITALKLRIEALERRRGA
jgi:hypothetical protein